MQIFKPAFLATCIALGLTSGPLVAQEGEKMAIPSEGALADGRLTQEEADAYAALAATQIQKLTRVAKDEVGDELKESGVVIPAAWMMMNDGEIKRVTLGKSGEQAAATMKVFMFRAAMKSLARHGKILGTAIVYAGNVEDKPNIRVLAIEHEHRLGVSGVQIVPYTFANGELSFGKPSTQKKPYELFYDEREATQGEG
ncbi:hypothetical protein BKP64_04895 [Marinobacter salinus]|uniref:Uncharacterized protein n=1 Tax=Marinobacter salinus TaxID=1874317 RepID=A0A1D9GJ35_9GAMM|nr:hypothetical protein [Marinobacter salinus]AOY87561.1 hypothetical protein BKP64_04895 [Marinobacter salinus]